jgi:TPR repeat protein
VALAQFVQANPSVLGAIGTFNFSEWGISDAEKAAAARCDAWTRSPVVDAVTGLPFTGPDIVADCETARTAYASTGAYDGHLAFLRLSQGPAQGAASVSLANSGAERKLPLALHTQAIMYEHGYELQMNLQRAADLYREAADMGLVVAQARLCKMFIERRSGWFLQIPNPLDFCNPAVDAGNSVAQHLLGFAYETGQWGLPLSLNRAADFYERSASQGNSIGQWRLGILYRDGRGVTRDFARAIELFEQAVAQDDPTAIRLMGMMYELGWGVPLDYVRAGALYEAANEAGDTIARQLIGYPPNAFSFGYPRDYPELEAMQALAATSNTIGQRILAYDFYVGVTRAPDPVEAFRLYTLAAETGDPIAQASLGVFYERGIGTPIDTAKALELYEASAAQGEMHGQFQLGAAYELGIGTERNIDLAKQYYRLAAAQGNRDALNRLDVLGAAQGG